MSIVIFDTETTSLEKPFCYNIGYVIKDTSNWETLARRDFVVEQVWHNTMLFSTAYYAEKRPIYVNRMRARLTEMEKFGYICQKMIRDFKAFDVESAYAYNSPFDEKVFAFNCDWFKTSNPFDNIPVFDIRGYAHNFIVDECYKEWCEEHEQFTETSNYSTTAETMYRYLFDEDFVEEHTALADSEIEAEILFACFDHGAEVASNYQPFRSIKREIEKPFKVKYNGETVFKMNAKSITYRKTDCTIILK